VTSILFLIQKSIMQSYVYSICDTNFVSSSSLTTVSPS